MATLIDKANLAGDATFTARVKAAMVERAATVLGGTKPSDAAGAARFALAARVLANLDDVASLFVMAVAVDDTIADAWKSAAANLTDTMIRQRVVAVWPYLAGE